MKHLFLPGMLCDERLWASQIACLKEHKLISNENTIIADLTQDDNITDMAQRVLASAEGGLNIIAFSLGTQVAFEIVNIAPASVKRLALFASAPGGFTPQMRSVLVEALLPAKKDFNAYLTTFFSRYLAEGGINYDETKQTFMAMATDLGQAVCLRQLNALITSKVDQSALKKITCPTLIVDGYQDHRLPPQVQHELHEAIPHSVLKLIPGVEHFSMLQAPEAVNKILVDWLARAV